MDQEWTQLKATVPTAQLDTASAVMSVISAQLMIEDYSDFSLNGMYGELVDETILEADRDHASVSVYIPSDGGVADAVAYLRDRFAAEGVDARLEIVGLREEDWAENWKQYYKPIKIGERLVIVPQWEKYDAAPDEVIIRMDPGMAFGTGTHETTRLVLGLLERYTTPGVKMLDVGCGTAILAICAAKLGASPCAAYDIDPVAVKVARENVKDNACADTVSVDQSDLLRQVPKGEKYGLVAANIVADIILRMAPDIGAYMEKGGILLASGIIEPRAAEVEIELCARGFSVVERAAENDWCALALRWDGE
ncbi:MAG: 50S ribosomal protein L11 methyltransferase [Clostridia bacterium]|nr:50S ribosomal protein L11 methyltransferase [Clostridia bacterium]